MEGLIVAIRWLERRFPLRPNCNPVFCNICANNNSNFCLIPPSRVYEQLVDGCEVGFLFVIVASPFLLGRPPKSKMTKTCFSYIHQYEISCFLKLILSCAESQFVDGHRPLPRTARTPKVKLFDILLASRSTPNFSEYLVLQP